MSESKEIALSKKILHHIRKAQRNLFERKAKLGEKVVIADKDGKPMVVPASEALRRMDIIDNKK